MRALVLAAILLAACRAPLREAEGGGVPEPTPTGDAVLELYGRSYGFRLGRPTALAPTPGGGASPPWQRRVPATCSSCPAQAGCALANTSAAICWPRRPRR